MAYYRGEFGRALVDLGQGVFTTADLEHSVADWCEPLRLTVWGHDLWTVPPPSQGYLTLAGSWMAEQVGIGSDPSDPLWAHLVVEASRAAGHDRPSVLHDGADGQALLAESRLRAGADRVRRRPRRRTGRRARRRRAGAGVPVPRLGDGDTTHLCAIDADGLGISLTQSNALDFGSHLVAGSTGIFLHNRGVGFSLEEGHPAELGPGSRPPHTLSPMLATTTDGSLTHLVGAMGGDAQPQILLQLLARMLPWRPGSADRGGRGPAGPRCTVGGTVPAVVGRRPDRAGRGPRSAGMDGRSPESGPSRPSRSAPSTRWPSAVPRSSRWSAAPDDPARHYVGAADPRSPEGGTAGR